MVNNGHETDGYKPTYFSELVCTLEHPFPVQFCSEKRQPEGLTVTSLGVTHKAQEVLYESSSLPESVPWISLNRVSLLESDLPTLVARSYIEMETPRRRALPCGLGFNL